MAIMEHKVEKVVIDLSTTEGNVFGLIALVVRLGKEANLNVKEITSQMISGDYNYALWTFNSYFGDIIDLKLPENISMESISNSVKKINWEKQLQMAAKNCNQEVLSEVYCK